MNSSPKFIVVIGTSTGGVHALEELIVQLTPEMDAAFFIVLHLARKGVGDVLFHHLYIPFILGSSSLLVEV